jgi:hypothetical protein
MDLRPETRTRGYDEKFLPSGEGSDLMADVEYIPRC